MGHNRFELNGRVAVVVGGTSGIGRTLALGNQCYRMFGAIWIRNYTFLTLGMHAAKNQCSCRYEGVAFEGVF